MSRTARADWAAQVPASGIIGVIAAKNLPASFAGGGGVVDVNQLAVAVAKILANSGSGGASKTPTSTPTATIAPIFPFVTWASDTLRPLESTTTEVFVAGVTSANQAVIMEPIGFDYLALSAEVILAGQVHVTVTNMSAGTITLPTGAYKMWIFT